MYSISDGEINSASYTALDIIQDAVTQRQPGENYAVAYFKDLTQEKWKILKRLWDENDIRYLMVFEEYEHTTTGI